MGVIGIDENSTYEFEVYPNPTRNFLNLNTPLDLGTKYTIELYDGRGRLVFGLENNDGTQSILDVNNLSQGVYQLMVRYETGIVWSEKVIIK